MKKQCDLFTLIKRLTPVEKRNFVIQSKVRAGEKKYLDLFWAIDKMNEYDENKLIKKLKTKGIEFAQLHVTKNALSKQILKSLRSYHEKHNIEQKLFALMADASLLEGKGLFKQCLKKLRSGFKLAEENEFFRYQAEIQQKIIDVSFRVGVATPQAFLSNNYLELSEIDFQASFKSRTRRVSHLSYVVSQSKGKISSEQLANQINTIRKLALPKIPPSKKSNFHAERNFHFANNLLDLTEGKNPKKHHEDILNAWEKKPHLKRNFSKEYKRDFANYLDACLFDKDIKNFEKLLLEFNKIQDSDFISEAESKQHYFHLYLLFCLRTNQMKKAEKLIPEINNCFSKYKTVLLPSRILTISFNVFLVLFGFERYPEAFDWLRRISTAKLKESRPDIQSFARVMELILNFEMGNHYYVENLHDAVMRNLKNQKQWGDFEKAVLTYVRKLTRTIDRGERKDLWLQLFNRLMDIKQKNKGKRLSFLNEVAVWCKSRSEEIGFFEAAKMM